MKKFTLILLSFCLLVYSVFMPETVNASSVTSDVYVEEDTAMSEVLPPDIAEVKDSQNIKEIKVVREQDQSEYIIRLEKQQNDHYKWTSKVLLNGELTHEATYDVESVSPDFSTTDLAELIKKGELNQLEEYYNKHIKFAEEEVQDEVHPTIVPLIVVGVYNITAYSLVAIEAAAYTTLTAYAASEVMDILEEKRQTSTTTVTPKTTETTINKWDEFTNIPTTIGSSATKHLTATAVAGLIAKMRNSNSKDNNLEIYVSTEGNIASKVMVVYDVKDSFPTTVNRHLGNYVSGSRSADPAYRNISLDLKGYTVFIVFNHNARQVFHAHWVPTGNRPMELQFQRYNQQYNVRIWPSVVKNDEYLLNRGRSDSDQLRWEQRYRQSQTARNNTLLRDSNGRKSVVPYK